jgi:hypothetical protein
MRNKISKIRAKTKLLTTASVISLAMATSALAQDASWWASVEGAMLTRDSDQSLYAPGLSLNLTEANSYAVELGYNQGGTPWSFGISARSTTATETGSYYYLWDESVPVNSAATMTESVTIIDLEIGRDIGVGNFQGRATLGVRSLSYSSSTEGYYDSWDDGYYDYTINNTFNGIGPRFAVEGSVPVSERVSIDTEVGMAILFGSRTYVEEGFDGDNIDLASDNEIATTLDISIAASYKIGANSKISLGYRQDLYANVSGYYDSWYSVWEGATTTNAGPFIKFTSQF